MNRRDFIGGCAAGAVAAGLPAVKADEPLAYDRAFSITLSNGIAPTIITQHSWDIAKGRWLVAAYCYKPPVMYSTHIHPGDLRDNPNVIALMEVWCRDRLLEHLNNPAAS